MIPTPKVWCPLSTDFYDVINIGKQPLLYSNPTIVDGCANLFSGAWLGYYANVSTHAYYGILNVMKAMTISFKLNIVNNNSTLAICDWAPINSSSFQIKLQWYNGNLTLQQGSSTTRSVALTDGYWHTLTLTYTGDTLKLYVDGSVAITYTTSSNSANSSANFIRPGRTDWSTMTKFASGYYKDFRIWDYVLDDNIIAAL